MKWFKHLRQRWTRGFDDTELWSLDETIAEFALPRLKAFREREKMGYPFDIRSKLGYPDEHTDAAADECCTKHWQWILGEMIFFLDKEQWHFDQRQTARYVEAQQLFGQYFGDLWD